MSIVLLTNLRVRKKESVKKEQLRFAFCAQLSLESGLVN